MKYRKKPVVIDAFKVKELCKCARNSWDKMPKMILEAYEAGIIVFGTDTAFISTLEGRMEAKFEDWIIRGVKGEFYPCKPDIFDQTYEPVEVAA